MVLIDYVHVSGMSQTVRTTFFESARIMGNVEILMFFENTFFFIKIIHIGEVFEVIKNNHWVKKGSRGRGGIPARGGDSPI